MTTEPSLWSFISNASPIVKCVILILLMASVASWTIIIQRTLYFKQRRRAAKNFEKRFWSGGNLRELFQETAHSLDTDVENLIPGGLVLVKRLLERGYLVRNSEAPQDSTSFCL